MGKLSTLICTLLTFFLSCTGQSLTERLNFVTSAINQSKCNGDKNYDFSIKGSIATLYIGSRAYYYLFSLNEITDISVQRTTNSTCSKITLKGEIYFKYSDGSFTIKPNEVSFSVGYEIADRLKRDLNRPAKLKIEEYVNEKLALWQKKGEFEKTSDYLIRVSEENRKSNIANWQKEKIDELSKLEQDGYTIKHFTLKEYDADNETYLLSGTDRNYIIKVPISSAPDFKQKFSIGKISDHQFILTDDGFKLCGFSISVMGIGTFTWSHTKDNPYQQTAINYNFDKAELNLPTAQLSNKQIYIEVKQINVGKSDVDVSIPSTNKKKPDAYVLAIGNEDYSSYQMSLDKEANVPFATNDADVFAKYCEKTLGIPIANISVLKNATLGQMGQAISKLEKLAEIGKGNAELIFYYAGHGLPNEETKESYLIPVDVSGSNLTSGIRLNELYSRLGKFPTKKVTVFLDACFSGGSRDGQLVALRSVRIKPKDETINGNMIVFTSSSGTESSAAYKEKGHGMFTYYLLKKLMESKGEATYKEMNDYLQREVLKQSVLINNKEQTPQVKTGNVDSSVWGGWRF